MPKYQHKMKYGLYRVVNWHFVNPSVQEGRQIKLYYLCGGGDHGLLGRKKGERHRHDKRNRGGDAEDERKARSDTRK